MASFSWTPLTSSFASVTSRLLTTEMVRDTLTPGMTWKVTMDSRVSMKLQCQPSTVTCTSLSKRTSMASCHKLAGKTGRHRCSPNTSTGTLSVRITSLILESMTMTFTTSLCNSFQLITPLARSSSLPSSMTGNTALSRTLQETTLLRSTRSKT